MLKKTQKNYELTLSEETPRFIKNFCFKESQDV